MEKIRYPEEWTGEERNRFCKEVADRIMLLDIASVAIRFATSPPPRREIEPGTIVHVSGGPMQWQRTGVFVRFYRKRDVNGVHTDCDGISWKYVRPVAPGWKPGDPLDPPNEGDL